MFDFMAKDWTTHLESWYSFDHNLWSQHSCDPYCRSMQRFQMFTDRIIAALRRDDDTSRALMQHDQLQKIYDGLPCFHEELDFHKWVKDATMKHPQRRTAKQYQWLFIVDLQEATPTGYIVLMAKRAMLSLEMWEDRALNVDNLSVDPDDKGYFFRNNHAVKDAAKDRSAVGESCWICANDFDADIHRPQQGPCGHIYCHECFKNTLAHALKPVEAKYTCAFCRSCLVCGVGSCEDHIIAHEKAPPYPLSPDLHLLCKEYCVADEEPYGMSPKRYWTFREHSRALRSVLSVQVYMRDLAVDPIHKARADEEVDQSIEKLREMAVQAHKLTLEDLEIEPVASVFIEDDPLD
jgi:hypothetical protein